MTVVIGAVVDNTVYLGGDSFIGDDESSDLGRDPKVFKLRDDVGFGVCGDVRAERLITKAAKSILNRRKKTITENWLIYDFSNQLHNKLKDSGVLKDDKGIHHLDGSYYVLAHKGHIYYLDDSLALWESQLPYVAIGAGRHIANGALGMANKSGLLQKDPEKAMKLVLDVCCLQSPWVRPPYTFIKI